MIVIQASKISKFFGDKKILYNSDLTLNAGEKIGLVGHNGAGKTTLLKIISGELSADEGYIHKPTTITVGYLPQKSQLSSGAIIIDEMYSVFQSLIHQENYLRELERKMGDPAVCENKHLFQQISAEYSQLSEEFRSNGGYEFRSNVKSILNGLGFREENHQQVVDTLSGGQKTRLYLAKLLIYNPDVLILDEPTNHLDLEALSWLEKYLISYPGTILVVSHDRYFLDTLVHSIYELDQGQLKRYTGNYSKFMELKREANKHLLKQYKKQQELIAKSEDFIRRNITRASTTKRAQSRRKLLEKMELINKPSQFKSAKFSFSVHMLSGKEVLKVRDLSIGYQGQVLLEKISFDVLRGERIALLGANGSGKTTLLKTLSGQLKVLGGHIIMGSNICLGYYDQEQSDLVGSKTVLEHLWTQFPHLQESYIRGILGNFLFSGDDVHKTLEQISGGERSKLALSKIMLSYPNFLLLDEPTNHLDVYSREILEDALAEYQGTVLFVSHDRYFLNKLSSRVIEISSDKILDFHGNYDDYLNYKKSDDNLNAGRDISYSKEQARQLYQIEKENQRKKEKNTRYLAQLESKIENSEQKIYLLEHEVFQPEVYLDLELLLKKNNELEREKEELKLLYEQWEQAVEENKTFL